MADYYSLTRDCIHEVQDRAHAVHGVRLQLYHHQCQYVLDELSRVLEFLEAKGPQILMARVQDIGVKMLLIHLHAGVKRAQILVERCCCENSSWLVTGTALVDIREQVISILLDLHRWKFMLNHVVVSRGGTWSFGDNDVLKLLKTSEEDYQRQSEKLLSSNDVFQKAALKDHEETLKEISGLVKVEDAQGMDRYIRGVYLKARINHTEEELQSVQELKEYTAISDPFLGSGASGSVMEVTWLGQQSALKIQKVVDSKEATLLKQLQHPNIVRFFHYWEDPTPRSCMLMELMSTDLRHHIRRQLPNELGVGSQPSSSKKKRTNMPFSLPVAIDIMLQVAEAMRHLHDRKLSHRDLKTSNILVNRVMESMTYHHTQGYLEVKLADFGLSKAYSDSSMSKDLTKDTGTTVYGAPEVFRTTDMTSGRKLTRKADVWSFGMVCSEILTGEMPFANEQRSTLRRRISENGIRPHLPTHCPAYLQFCITSCWELQPARRPRFSDLCRLLRHAKFLSLELIQMPEDKLSLLFAYKTYGGDEVSLKTWPVKSFRWIDWMFPFGTGGVGKSLPPIQTGATLPIQSLEESEACGESIVGTSNSTEDSEGIRLVRGFGGGIVGLRMAARRLTIIWGDNPQYWTWISDPYSLFSEVAKLEGVWWLEARGHIDGRLLAPGTYTFSWRIHLKHPMEHGWISEPVHFRLSKNDMEDKECKCFMSTSPDVSRQPIGQFKLPTIRVCNNGWREYDVGEFSVVEGEERCMLKFTMKAVREGQGWKTGLRVDGIHIFEAKVYEGTRTVTEENL